MNSKEYIDGVLRTESGRWDCQHVDEQTLIAVLSMFCGCAEMLDAIKRGLFYGKPMTDPKLANKMTSGLEVVKLAVENLENLKAGKPSGANTTAPGYGPFPVVSPRMVHAALGMGTEAGETIYAILDAMVKNQGLDYANLFEELSDSQWYTALAIDSASGTDPESIKNFRATSIEEPLPPKLYTPRHWTYESIWEKNLAKLKARYPDKFDTEKAFNRDVTAEKKAME